MKTKHEVFLIETELKKLLKKRFNSLNRWSKKDFYIKRHRLY